MDENEIKELFKAITFAADKLKDANIEDNEPNPYINLRLNMLNFMFECGASYIHSDYLCAAVLHNAMDYMQCTYDEIHDSFNYEVTEIVKACSFKQIFYCYKQKNVEKARELINEDRRFIKDGIVYVTLARMYCIVSSFNKRNGESKFYTQYKVDCYNRWALYLCTILFEHVNVHLLNNPKEREFFENMKKRIISMFNDNDCFECDDLEQRVDNSYNDIIDL